jgi:hypothetical protein
LDQNQGPGDGQKAFMSKTFSLPLTKDELGIVKMALDSWRSNLERDLPALAASIKPIIADSIVASKKLSLFIEFFEKENK